MVLRSGCVRNPRGRSPARFSAFRAVFGCVFLFVIQVFLMICSYGYGGQSISDFSLFSAKCFVELTCAEMFLRL
jgi:hypothetical protein